MSAGAPRYEFKPGALSSHGRILRFAQAWPRTFRILEVGTAGGFLGRELRARGFTKLVGLELDPELAAQARPHYDAHYVMDLERAPDLGALGSFDACICGDVLEHVQDPWEQLRRLSALLRPEGEMVVSLPNAVNWSVRLMVLSGRFEYEHRGLLDRGHVRFFTRRTARRLLEDAGLRVKRLDATPLPLAYALPRWLPSALRAGLEWGYAGLVACRPTLFAYQFVFLAERTRPVTVLRMIGRLNIGGPARQAVFLTRALGELGEETRLVTGVPDEDEGDMGYLAAEQGVRREIIPELRRALHPWRDAQALVKTWRLLARERPAILHTHTAKAGSVGRAAAALSNGLLRVRYLFGERGAPCRVVHTFHGHVLSGYFGEGATRVFVMIERLLARVTDRIIVVSHAAKRDLLALRIGRPEQIRVIPLGFDLDALATAEACRGRFRAACGLGAGPLIGLVGRLVPIKHPALLLEAAERVARTRPGDATYVLVGDGALRGELEALAKRRGLEPRVRFIGWRRDMTEVYADLDILCLTSLNEGLPAAVIEAMAAGKPVVATDVGGVRELLTDDPEGRTPRPIAAGQMEVTPRGVLVGSGDAEGLAAALSWLLQRPMERARMGVAGRQFALQHFTQERLLRDIMQVYQELTQMRTSSPHTIAIGQEESACTH